MLVRTYLCPGDERKQLLSVADVAYIHIAVAPRILSHGPSPRLRVIEVFTTADAWRLTLSSATLRKECGVGAIEVRVDGHELVKVVLIWTGTYSATRVRAGI